MQLNIAFKELLNNKIVHRNITPSNILIKYLNEEKTDFDSIISGYTISKKTYENNSIEKAYGGNMLFMAPESFEGNFKNLIYLVLE